MCACLELYVFWGSGVVFWVSGLVFRLSGIVFWVSGLVFWVCWRGAGGRADGQMCERI